MSARPGETEAEWRRRRLAEAPPPAPRLLPPEPRDDWDADYEPLGVPRWMLGAFVVFVVVIVGFLVGAAVWR